jgi:peptidoglycan LD-endopeptidase LytH
MNRFPLFPDGPYSYAQNFTLQHLGIDIMAPRGTPVLAVDDGKAWRQIDTKGGKVVYLAAAKETYYYAHLDEWYPTLADAAHRDEAIDVRAGDALGFIGNTGNAAGRPPHLHFQIRRGSLTIDPFADLQAVDPHPERGTSGTTIGPRPRQWPSLLPNIQGPIALLALLWLFSQSSRR